MEEATLQSQWWQGTSLVQIDTEKGGIHAKHT